jgi:predicted deacylase
VGDRVEAGQSLARIHARTDDGAARAELRFEQALELADAPIDGPPLVLGRVDPS